MTTAVFPPGTEERLAVARQAADAVLFEGYVLYPYRASAAKNRFRWQFGVLVPPSWNHAGDHCLQHTECLMEPKTGAELAVEVRFLRVRRRTVEELRDDGTYAPVPELRLADRTLATWDEGTEERITLTVPVAALDGEGTTVPFTRPAAEETEEIADTDGRLRGRLVRRHEEISGVLRISAAGLDGPYRVSRLSVTVENTSPWQARPDDDRPAALARSLVAAHTLLRLDAGSFLSMTDPPEWARSAVAACDNRHTWPVLAGEPGRADLLLSSPIILDDHPAIAPESPGAFYDATEIDEMLALRTTTLTEEEKREARGTDARAAAVIDLADTLPQELLERLHGAVRGLREVTGGQQPPGGQESPVDALLAPDTPWWDPAGDPTVDPDRDHVLVEGRAVRAGSRVLLCPRLRRSDAQDLFLDGRSALVEAVLHDVDGGTHIAVTVEDDPGADIRREQGRFLYFQPDEVRPLEGSCTTES
ncbi:hypothetical protein ACGFRB_24830 [Streptomyces sp. NPDC048718]|uniref:hypothetical protein n=1 Tax=Streptomyces sp. NPDC048718 TaxID=3365587 RepID=UPI0037191E34